MKSPHATIVTSLQENIMSNDPNPLDPKDLISNPISRPTTTADKIVEKISDKILATVKTPLDQRFARLTPEQKSELEIIEERVFIHFTGQLDELESALGMLRIGHHMGWKVLYMIHSKKTIRKYEEILDIKIRDIFPDEGPSANRSVGLGIAKRFSNFWKVVSGEAPMNKEEKENRRKIE